MNTIDASTEAASAHDGTRQRGAATPRCAAGSEPTAGEMRLTIGDIDFSRVNLQYLICARDLARVDLERTTVLLGVPDDLVQLLAELDAAVLGARDGGQGAAPDTPSGTLVVAPPLHRAPSRSPGRDSGRSRTSGAYGRQ
jgi:hypothetical protein